MSKNHDKLINLALNENAFCIGDIDGACDADQISKFLIKFKFI